MSARPLTTIPSPTYEAQRKQVMIAEQQCSQMQGIDGDPRYYLAWHVLVLRAELDATRAQLAETLAVLEELVAEYDTDCKRECDETPGYGWPNETGGMVLARAAIEKARAGR